MAEFTPREKKRIRDVAKVSTSVTDTYELLKNEFGIGSHHTFHRRVRKDPQLEQTLHEIYEENAIRQGVKASQRLEGIVDDESLLSDTDGQRISLDASSKLLARSDKIIERKSKIRQLEQELKDKTEEIKELQNKINKVSSGSIHGAGACFVPIYMVEYGTDYYQALEEQQQKLLEYIAIEAGGGQ